MLKVLFAACTFTLAAAAHAQSTAFTYQGQLQSSGQLASGVFDLRFELLNSATGGLPVAPPVCIDNVQVADGQFTATLDFGAVFAAAGPRFLQISVRPDTGLPCGNTTGLTVLSPRTQITPAPVATHASRASGLRPPNGSAIEAVFVDTSGQVGVGTTTPGATVAGTKLDVVGGPFLVANSGDQADLLWLASERSWVFRQEGVGAGAALKLQSIGGGGNKHFVIQTDGLVGIGTTTPGAKLDVRGDFRATSIDSPTITASDFRGGVIRAGPSVFQGGASFSGVLVGNHTAAFSGSGVLGTNVNSDASSWGVFSQGRFGASGTKAFRIDHPDDPANRYLLHYCAESPEVINFYRGTIMLDSHGHATVQLPAYFAKINANPSYHLTPVGAPMPTLHVATEINQQALALGALAGPEMQAPICWFEIAGGAPGGKVSWRVEAVRNDDFMRRNGAPVEVRKPDHERGMTDLTPSGDAP